MDRMVAFAALIPILLGCGYVWKERDARAEGAQVASIVIFASFGGWIAWVTCVLLWLVWRG